MFAHYFTLLIYQPFFNLLVGIYWVLLKIPHFPHPDMGVAVIVFTVALRFILLPLTFAGERSEKERHLIEDHIKELKEKYIHDPVTLNKELKVVFKARPSMMFAEGFNLFIQVSIAIMLWRIFASGLEGADIHLLYNFMPHPPEPYNLLFWGIFDLSHPHMSLNLIQSLIIFVLETFHMVTSPFPVTRSDVIRLQIFLPIVSFLIFSMLPAGKKLFVITTLLFSLIYSIVRFVQYKLSLIFASPTPTPDLSAEALPAQAGSAKVEPPHLADHH